MINRFYKNGFSLLEAVVSIALIGVIIVVSFRSTVNIKQLYTTMEKSKDRLSLVKYVVTKMNCQETIAGACASGTTVTLNDIYGNPIQTTEGDWTIRGTCKSLGLRIEKEHSSNPGSWSNLFSFNLHFCPELVKAIPNFGTKEVVANMNDTNLPCNDKGGYSLYAGQVDCPIGYIPVSGGSNCKKNKSVEVASFPAYNPPDTITYPGVSYPVYLETKPSPTAIPTGWGSMCCQKTGESSDVSTLCVLANSG